MKTPHKLSVILILWVQAVVLNACIVPATPQAAADVASPGLEEIATSAAASEAGACETGFRLFDHELLATDPICIPSNPQRIAFIDSVIAYAIALEVDSVTKNYYFDAFLGDFPTLVDEATINKMADVGNTWELNPESLALAIPDLIVSATWWSEVNAQIQTIAPTVIFDHDRATSWLQTFDAIAQLTERKANEAALLQGIEERIAALRTVLGDRAAETTFTVVIIESPAQLWAFTSKNFGAELAFQVGLSLADTIPTPEEALATTGGAYAVGISLEQLSLIEADHIFLFTNWNSGMEKALFANPVWQNFAAKNPARIHYLNGEYWVRDHPISAHRILDDLFRYVAKVDPAEVAPNPFAYTYPQPTPSQ